ncbi:MAG: ABC transporter ATP-binding protein [Dehalococcoidia bacterium]|nr:MAG: ABC transporter ATP-binding protein [Dehalococcoidia bacterium]
MAALLQLEGVSKRFGGVQAVNQVSLEVQPGRVTGVIGPNGSGKTSLFNLISGVVRADSGRIVFAGREITHLPPYRINALGIGRMFQLTRLFGQMTALENLLAVRGSGDVRRAMELLAFVGLDGLAHEYAANLSYGQQKLVEFVRVMMADPQLVLLDEPFAGVNPKMEERLIAYIRELLQQGKTFLLTDHEMPIIMSLCHELFVMDSGELIAHGSPAAIRENPRVIEAYFGR